MNVCPVQCHTLEAVVGTLGPECFIHQCPGGPSCRAWALLNAFLAKLCCPFFATMFCFSSTSSAAGTWWDFVSVTCYDKTLDKFRLIPERVYFNFHFQRFLFMPATLLFWAFRDWYIVASGICARGGPFHLRTTGSKPREGTRVPISPTEATSAVSRNDVTSFWWPHLWEGLPSLSSSTNRLGTEPLTCKTVKIQIIAYVTIKYKKAKL